MESWIENEIQGGPSLTQAFDLSRRLCSAIELGCLGIWDASRPVLVTSNLGSSNRLPCCLCFFPP